MAAAVLVERLKHGCREWCGFWMLLIVVGVMSGCGGSDGGSPVRGTVTYQGKTLERGTVLFNPVDTNMPPARAAIQPDGTYELSAAPGEYKITVSLFTEPDPNQDPEAPGYVGPKSLLPEKYLSFRKTPLQFAVEQQETIIDLEL